MNSPSAPKILSVGSAIFLAASLALAGRASADEYSKSYSVTGRPSVRVDSDNGAIRVTTSDGSKVELNVKYDKSAWESAGEKGPLIDSHQTGNSVELTAYIHPDNTVDWNPLNYAERRLTIELHIPRNADLQLQTHNGVVDVSSVDGNVTIRTHNGGVTVAHLSGTLDIDSHNGGITLDGVKGSTKVGAHNGRIVGNGLDGKCEVSTHNGAVEITGRFDLLDVTSQNGAVRARAEGGSKMSSAWRIETTNARIELEIPTDLKATLNAGTTHARVTFDVPATLQGDSRGRGNKRGGEVRGTLNGGGPELLIRTTNGAIDVHKA